MRNRGDKLMIIEEEEKEDKHYATSWRLQKQIQTSSGRETARLTLPKPWRTEGGGSRGTPFRSSLSLGVVPDIGTAPAIKTAFTSGPLGEAVWLAFLLPDADSHSGRVMA